MLYVYNPSSSGDDSVLINDGRYRTIESVDKQINKIIKLMLTQEVNLG